MTEDFEQLSERYLEAQLREELGPETDLSDRVLQAVYGKPRRVIPGPKRPPAWKPLAAAAAVLIAAGLAAYALVTILPEHLRPHDDSQRAVHHPRSEPAIQLPKAEQKPEMQPQSAPSNESAPVEDGLPPEPDAQPEPEPQPEDTVVKDPPPAEGGDTVVLPDPEAPGWTDPPEAWPDPRGGKYADPVESAPVLVASWKGESLRVTQVRANGHSSVTDYKFGDPLEIRAGDRVKPKGVGEFVLHSGTLLRLDGEMTFGGEAEAVSIALIDGALYADTAVALSVTKGDVSATVNGVAVLEERLHGMDVFCVSGQVTAGEDLLLAGFQARLQKDGFGRDKKITWEDVQREFRFLKDKPRRLILREEMTETPDGVFGGTVKDGLLAGESDSEDGIGFYLHNPHAVQTGDVVRMRVRLGKACELILQFGTVASSNWRHKFGTLKAGEWLELEMPLTALVKTLDPDVKASAGLELKFFQLHPEDASTNIDIDWVEIVHQP